MTQIISPHTMRPVTAPAVEPAPPETPTRTLPTPEEVGARYKVTAGRLLVAKREIDAAWDKAGLIAMTEERREMAKQFEPWGTVLLIGEPAYTDQGVKVEADPEVKVGSQILFNPAGGQDVDISVGDCTMVVTLIGFRNVLMIDRVAAAETVPAADRGEPWPINASSDDVVGGEV